MVGCVNFGIWNTPAERDGSSVSNRDDLYIKIGTWNIQAVGVRGQASLGNRDGLFINFVNVNFGTIELNKFVGW